jgi:hypothetical protein
MDGLGRWCGSGGLLAGVSDVCSIPCFYRALFRVGAGWRTLIGCVV